MEKPVEHLILDFKRSISKKIDISYFIYSDFS